MCRFLEKLLDAFHTVVTITLFALAISAVINGEIDKFLLCLPAMIFAAMTSPLIH